MEYGVLTPLVKSVGWLMASSVAIGLAWRRRSRWEPSEEDVSGGPAKVGGLLAAVAIAVIWSQLISPDKRGTLVSMAIGAAGVMVVCLLAYGYLVAVNTYRFPDLTSSKNIIGGLWLTPEARRGLSQSGNLSIEELLADRTVERIWPRSSRALSKILFVVMYLGLTVAGSVALTCAAALVLLSNTVIDEGPECHWKDFHNKPLENFAVCAERWPQLGIWPNTFSVAKNSAGLFVSGSFNPHSARRPFRYLVSRKDYAAELQSQKLAGFRPEHVSILNTDDGLRYTAVWTAIEGEDYRADLDLTTSQFTTLDQQLRVSGFVLSDFTVYQDSGTRLAAIWVRRANEGYQVLYDLTRSQFAARLLSLSQAGYQLRHFVGSERGGEYSYGGIWEKNVPAWYFEYDLKGAEYQDYYDAQAKSGHRMHQIVAYGDYFASIWHDPPTPVN